VSPRVALGLALAAIVESCGGQVNDMGDAEAGDASADVSIDAPGDALSEASALDAGVLMGCATKIAAGVWNTCAIENTGALWCWGFPVGDLGKGGLGSMPCGGGLSGDTCAFAPVRIEALGTAVMDVAVGSEHICAVKNDGTVWCWGDNSYGQLGDGTTTARTSPTLVQNITKVVAIATVDLHTCALKSDATAWCWGFNLGGQLGDGTTTNSPTPVQVVGVTSAAAVQCGESYSCARKTDGTAWCWGHGVWGELGNGSTTLMSPPVQVATLGNSVADLSTNWDHACASENDGSLYCWGLNASGDVGKDGGIESSPNLVTDLSNMRSIAAGLGHNCVIRLDGTIWCFGDNADGELTGTTQGGPTPVEVSSLPGSVTQLVAGDSFTCALLGTGAVRCWGRNDYGQLGNGAPSTSSCACERTPVAVLAKCP
jgi:alpha-tubulin suppressor-like RCC1 family protein